MYLLSYVDSTMFRSKFQDKLFSSGGYLSSSSGSDMRYLELAKTLDPDFQAEKFLSIKTRGVLEDLQGRSEGRGYYRSQHSLNRLRPDMVLGAAQAMVLADRGYGLFDELCVSLLEEVFSERYPGLRAYCFTVSTSIGAYSWEDLFRPGAPFAGYLLPGRDLIALDGTKRELPRGLTLKHGKETVALGLKAVPGEGVYWSLRGVSRIKFAHIDLVEKLNGAMDDYRDRLKRMDEYLMLPRDAGYSQSQQDELKDTLGYFQVYSLTGFEPGRRFGDMPVHLERNHRGFHVRCELCRAPYALEIVRGDVLLSDEEWKDPKKARRVPNREFSINSRLASFHFASKCAGTVALSSRTGEKIAIEAPLSYRGREAVR